MAPKGVGGHIKSAQMNNLLEALKTPVSLNGHSFGLAHLAVCDSLSQREYPVTKKLVRSIEDTW